MKTDKLLLLLLLELVLFVLPTDAEETCQWETFEAHCIDNHVIHMEMAVYGRLGSGRCSTTNFGFEGCSADVMGLAERKCSGRSHCVISVPDKDMAKAAATTCPVDLVTYLTANYTCMKVQQTTGSHCDIQSFGSHGEHGYLASALATHNQCGTPTKPWIFRVTSAQMLNLTLHDFSSPVGASMRSNNPIRVHKESCNVYAIIKTAGNTSRVCGGISRQHLVMTSQGQDVELRILPGKVQKRYFLLEYHISGCSEPSLPDGAWVTYSGNTATIGCHNDHRIQWHLQCIDGKWDGNRNMDACSPDAILGLSVKEQTFHVPTSLAVAIILCVAFILGFIILTIGVYVIKRRRHQRGDHPELQYNLPTELIYKDSTAVTQSGYTRHQTAKLPAIPNYHGNPPPYSAHTLRGSTSPEHDYEYVADVIARIANNRQATQTNYDALNQQALKTSKRLSGEKPAPPKRLMEYKQENNQAVTSQHHQTVQATQRFDDTDGLANGFANRHGMVLNQQVPANRQNHSFGHYSQ